MKISEIIERLNKVKERRMLAEELLKNALAVFRSTYPLKQFDENFDKYWKELEYKCLYDAQYYYGSRFETLGIRQLFLEVTEAHISRSKFETQLNPFKVAVERFIKEKKKEEETLKKTILEAYDQFFACNFMELSFIFKSQEVKQAFLEFLQS